jgi:hypothetical protein
LEQARSCASRSPLYAGLCRRLAEDPRVSRLAPDLRWDVPLRLLGGMHYLALSGSVPDAFESWERFSHTLDEQTEFLSRFVAEREVQTNEVQRSWVLLPCFLEVARRTGAETFDLIELGPSAGLNLVWDRYRYRFEAGQWGAPDAPLQLEGEERTAIPHGLLELAPSVAARIGIDASPLDVTSEDDARLLKSFVWADQIDRLRRLDRAIDALRSNPPELVQGDFVELLPQVLSKRRATRLTVVFQTGTLGYLTPEQRSRLHSILAAEGEAAPLAFVSTGVSREPGATHWGVSLRIWPDGDRELLAEADYHGAWLEWLA